MKPDVNGKFRCFTCQDMFSTRQALSRHRTSKHSTVITTYQCPYCAHEGGRAYDVISKHIPRVHVEKVGIVKMADICEVTRTRPRAPVSRPAPETPRKRERSLSPALPESQKAAKVKAMSANIIRRVKENSRHLYVLNACI